MTSKRKVLDRMVMALAGRVSEEIFFGDDAVGSGASDDFRKVTAWATTYVTTWGMSKRVGPVYYASNPEELQKPFSEETARIIVQPHTSPFWSLFCPWGLTGSGRGSQEDYYGGLRADAFSINRT
jgi:Peptidase family M41